MSTNGRRSSTANRVDLATVLATLAEGSVNRDATAAFEAMVAKLRERAARTGSKKKGSVTIKLDLMVTEAAVEMTAKVDTKAEGIASADVWFVSPQGELLRTHPKQLELDEQLERASRRDLGDDNARVRDIGGDP